MIHSNLLDNDTIRSALGAIQTNHGGVLPLDATIVASELVDGGVLSQWQARNLLKGKSKGFFLGKYKLIRQLGKGGMSVVYLGEHTVMLKRSAIKVLPKKLNDRGKSLSRFQQEARACAMLEHPNIVQVTDFDTVDGRHMMVMEYVDGTDLQGLVRSQGPLPIPNVVEFLHSAAMALQHAHERGIIHRDIKPLNMLINRDCVLKVTDFGLARLSYHGDPNITENAKSVLGTADYLAPEQATDAGSVDGRSDLYSLGCTLYFMLVGRAPFAEGTLKERIARHRTKPAPDPRVERPDCPSELASICARLLAKNPEERFQTASQLIQHLRKIASGITASVQVTVPSAAQFQNDPSAQSSGSLGLSMDADTSISGVNDHTFSSDSGDGLETAEFDDLFSDLPVVQVAATLQHHSTRELSNQRDPLASPPAVTVGSPAFQSPQTFAASGATQQIPVDQNKNQKLMVMGGIAMAAFSIIFSIAMALVYMNQEPNTRNLIKNSEAGRGSGNVIIIPE